MTLCPKCGADWDVVGECIGDPHPGNRIIAQQLVDSCSCCRAHFRGEGAEGMSQETTVTLTQQDLVKLVGDGLAKFCPRECPYGHLIDPDSSMEPTTIEEFVAEWTKEAESGGITWRGLRTTTGPRKLYDDLQ